MSGILEIDVRCDGLKVNSEIIRLFNEGGELRRVLDRTASLVAGHLGCEALGIRVMDSLGNIPYESTVGFTDGFIEKEGHLCTRRDRCACTLASRGEYDPELPFFTKWGSFHSGEVQDLEVLRLGMKDGSFRGECVRMGWESLLVAPVRFGHKYFGLIHAVDGGKDAFPPDMVGFVENVAGQLGLYMHGVEVSRTKEAEFSSLAMRIAHDLRSPITSTKMFAELMPMKYDSCMKPEVADMLGSISRNADYMEELVSGLTAFARSDDPASTQMTDIYLDTFLDSLVEDMGLSEQGGARVSVSGVMPKLRYPAVSLKRILTNLVSNAVKFSAASEAPAVEISCEVKDTFYQLAVSDNGMGMEPHEVDKVFEPFFRTQGAKAVPGTGLGLSICRKIVEKHGGRIWVYSDKGAGSTFYFTVPK
ncbi:MAG: GAF domain-containing sensor histidine kinase [Nitrospirae bacterium]|nr:GAF domain-containing sensor histidine kinase [Nitrospirota bacterium]